MKKHLILMLSFFIISLSACGGDEAADVSPTSSGTSVQRAASTPQQMQLAMLDLNPTAYDGDLVEIVGQLSFRPRIVCSGEVQESPATWQLTADDATIFVGGFDEQVRLLLHEEQTMRVVGRWIRWQGPVGCTDSAQQEQFRYLEVTRILWPSPLSNATLTPDAARPNADGTAVANEPTNGDETETDTAVANTLTFTPAPTLEQSPTEDAAATPTPNSTPTALNSPTPGSSPSAPTGTPSATATSTPTTAVNTPGPGTPSATPTAVVSPTATATTPSGNTSGTATPTQPATFTLINQGQIDPEELAGGSLKPREIHSFSFTMDDLDEVTIVVAGEPTTDLVISLVDEFGSQISEFDSQIAGGIERIDSLPLTLGSYTIQIREKTGQAGSYMIMLLFSESYAYSFMDVISYGQSVSGATAEDNDHFWLFYGETGDVITITAVSSNMGDLFLELYDPNAVNVSDYVDEGLEGEPEILAGFTLANTGLYAIRIGEYDFNPMTYQLVVNKEG